METGARVGPGIVPKWIGGALVAGIMAIYYVVFYFPPRLVGSNEPDRYYHLALSELIAAQGFPKSLPQVEDLGWGSYFPDKEFLFHALTGGAYWLAGPVGVHLVVALLGICIATILYAMLLGVLAPWKSVVLTSASLLLFPVFLFRITLLRPHLLAILFFCVLLAGILRGRAALAAIGAAGFALSYHAFYIPALVIVVAVAFQSPGVALRQRPWVWAAIGLLFGIVLNPYFPSTLVMSWAVVKIALGIGLAPGLRSGSELLQLGGLEYLGYFGFLPLAVVVVGVLMALKKLRPAPGPVGVGFLFTLSALLTLLSMKSPRATEYAVPCVILLSGYALASFAASRALLATCLALIVTQGYASWGYYSDIWSKPQEGTSGWYMSAIQSLPPEASGSKVFNCQWEAGSYILFFRPDVRFVDLLEPALLWQASPRKYMARERLLTGLQTNPQQLLGDTFHADYVLCGTQAFNRQMEADPVHFEPITQSNPTGPLRVFRIRE